MCFLHSWIKCQQSNSSKYLLSSSKSSRFKLCRSVVWCSRVSIILLKITGLTWVNLVLGNQSEGVKDAFDVRKLNNDKKNTIAFGWKLCISKTENLWKISLVVQLHAVCWRRSTNQVQFKAFKWIRIRCTRLSHDTDMTQITILKMSC